MLGNSRIKLPDAMHAGQERSVRRGRGLAASAASVQNTDSDKSRRSSAGRLFHTAGPLMAKLQSP